MHLLFDRGVVALEVFDDRLSLFALSLGNLFMLRLELLGLSLVLLAEQLVFLKDHIRSFGLLGFELRHELVEGLL